MALYSEKFTTDAEWVEAWIDEYILHIFLVIKRKNGAYLIVNPAGENYVQVTFHDYEDVRTWLLEDEYNRIETRYTSD